MKDIEIEYYEKGKDILLILTGIGGTTKGYNNKYEKIALNTMKKQDLSVVVATSPTGSWLHTEQNLKQVMDFIIKTKGENVNIYAMGLSAGANILLWHSFSYPQIKKILAINPIMNINIHLLKSLRNTEKEYNIVLGELDTSSKFVSFFPQNKKIKVDILPNVDHYFSNQLDLFIELPNIYLFKNSTLKGGV